MNSLQELAQEFDRKANAYQKRVGAKEILETRAKEIREEVEQLDELVVSTEKAIWLLQQYAENQQNLLTARIEGIVTKGLRAVFQNESLEFKLRYSETKKGEKKKTPEISMHITYEHEGETVEGNLKSSFGGGLSVVAATILRVVVILHLGGRVRPVIILDEPLKDLSPAYGSGDDVANGYRERMADFLRSLVDETDLQIIMVSHEPEYGRIADVHHRFSGGVGEISKVRTSYMAEELEEFDE